MYQFDDFKGTRKPFEDIDNVSNKPCVNLYLDLLDKMKRIYVNVKYSKDYIEDQNYLQDKES